MSVTAVTGVRSRWLKSKAIHGEGVVLNRCFMKGSRPIFVSTACLPGVEPIHARLSVYQSHGLDAIELGAGVYACGDDLPRIARSTSRFLVHNYFPPPAEPFVLNLASANEDIRQKSLDLVLAALALTADLGAPFYSVHAGFITDPVSFGSTSFVFPMPALPDEKQSALNRFVTALEIAVGHAERLGVQLLVENNVCTTELRGKLLLQTAGEFEELFQALPSPSLGMLLDTGHLNVTAHTFGFERMGFVKQAEPYVKALHIHDNDGTADTHGVVQLDSWVLDVLCQPRFTGDTVIIESRFETAADLRRHADWLAAELDHQCPDE